jgi:mono/diheme cytochrome c family protein
MIASLFLFGSAAVAAQHDEKAEGTQLFKTNCAMCHGADGSGNTPMGKKLNLKDLGSSEVQKMSDAEMKQLIENGGGSGTVKMPAFKSRLKPEQVQDLVAYIRSLAK